MGFRERLADRGRDEKKTVLFHLTIPGCLSFCEVSLVDSFKFLYSLCNFPSCSSVSLIESFGISTAKAVIICKGPQIIFLSRLGEGGDLLAFARRHTYDFREERSHLEIATHSRKMLYCPRVFVEESERGKQPIPFNSRFSSSWRSRQKNDFLQGSIRYARPRPDLTG